MKYVSIALLALLITACSPRFGHDPDDPEALPLAIGFGYMNDYRYKQPTDSYIPNNLPLGVLKQEQRPPYYKPYDRRDAYTHKDYGGRA